MRELVLALQPGARRVVLEAAPLDMASLGSAGDAAYRHLALENKELRWQPLPDASRVAPAASVPVLLADRNGTPLWQGGRPLDAANGAGLGTLLGLREGHANSIAGMLGRLPAPNGRPHAGRLTLDLALQGAAQGALDCVGLRRGQWDGARCSGGAAPAPGRQAGLVLLDTGSGDILAAASAQAGAPVSAAPWNELRDFDRVDSARSPLRQAALQHGGGRFARPKRTRRRPCTSRCYLGRPSPGAAPCFNLADTRSAIASARASTLNTPVGSRPPPPTTSCNIPRISAFKLRPLARARSVSWSRSSSGMRNG